LVWLLNQRPNDLPNAMITRWLPNVPLLDFQVKRIPVNKNDAPNALSRCGLGPNGLVEDENEADDSFDAKLYFISTI